MAEDRREPERLNLAADDDPRDVIHRAVACLAQGGLAVLPTETSYVLVAGATNPQAVERLRRAKSSGVNRPISLGVRSPEELTDWVHDVSLPAKKLARRAWPGPMTMILHGDVGKGLAGALMPSVRSAVAPENSVALRMPSHEVIREVSQLLSGPFILTDAPSKTGGRAKTVAELEPGLDVDMIVDDGPTAFRERNSVVQLDAAGWSLVRSGVIPEDELRRMGGRIVLFVCTGNTCRSPMAEAICRLILAEKLGCALEELENHGFTVGSAGLAASRGAKAAREAAEVVRSRGGSLSEHSSRQLDREMIAAADLIIAMTRDHLDAILEEHPVAEERVRLLHSKGLDIDDPIGSDRATYARTAQDIETHIRGLLEAILALT